MKRTLIALAAAGAALSAQAVTVYSNDFESNIGGMSGYGAVETTQGYAAYGFGQQFFRNDASGNPANSSFLTFNVAGNASGATLSVDLAIIDSWDDPNSWCCGLDRLNIKVDGNLVFSAVFGASNTNGAITVAPGLTNTYFGGDIARNGGWTDAAYNLTLALGNLSAGAHTVEFYASSETGFQGGWDESFAIDNIVVSAQVVPEPSTYALMALGLAGVGALARRRRTV